MNTRSFNQHTPIQKRFDASYIPEPNSGCWLWIGAASRVNKAGTDIRPTIRVDGKTRRAHRVSYELHNGLVSPGKLICHHCDTPLCVNPDHLYAGSAKSNAADSISRKRHNSQRDPEAARRRGAALGSRNTWSRGNAGKFIIPRGDIVVIRERLAHGESLAKIASGYGVSKQAVSQRLKRAALAAVKGEQP